MRPAFTFLLVVVLVGLLAWSFSRVPEALAKMETFRITEVRVEGNRFLTREEALTYLGLPTSASVWEDLAAWEDRLRNHPLVEDIRIHRRLPGTLVLEITEAVPVALVPNPTLEPVDASGRFLPIDPSAHRLDLPLLALGGDGRIEDPSAAERRLMAGEVARISQQEPEFLARISEVTLHHRGDLRAQVWRRDSLREVWDLPINLLFRPHLSVRRIHNGLRVLEDARIRFEGAEIRDLDLRYEDQVVIRLTRAEER